MTKLTRFALYLVLGLLLAACGSANDPRSVAEGFWQAMMERDIEKARGYTTAESGKTLKLRDNGEGDVNVAVGEMTEKESEVTFATTMTSTVDGQEQKIPLETILVREDGTWKVDANRTMFSIFGGAVGQMMGAMKKGFQDMGRAMQRGLEERQSR